MARRKMTDKLIKRSQINEEIRLINGKIFSLHLDDADVWNNEITTTIKTQNMKNENLKFN